MLRAHPEIITAIATLAALWKSVYDNAGCGGLHRPYSRIHARRDGDALASSRLIGDHSATNGRIRRIAPQDTAGFGIEAEYIAVQITGENQTSGSGRDCGDQRRRGFV